MISAPLASVVVLSYNRPQQLSAALESVVSQSYGELEVLVVDNRSGRTDEIVRIVQGYPHMRLLCNPINLGFTGGMNIGILDAKGKYVFLTEDDIILDRQCIRNLVSYMEADPEVGLASGLMFNKSDNTIRCAGGAVMLGPIYRKTVFGAGQSDSGQFREPYDVNYVPGAFIMARADILRNAGGFRNDFFMYFEDTELCLRMRKLGYRIVVVPSATVHHWDPPATIPDRRIEVDSFKNLLSLYTLHARLRILPEFFVRYVAVALAKSVTKDPHRARTILRGFVSYLLLVPSLVSERCAWLHVKARAIAVPPDSDPCGKTLQ